MSNFYCKYQRDIIIDCSVEEEPKCSCASFNLESKKCSDCVHIISTVQTTVKLCRDYDYDLDAEENCDDIKTRVRENVFKFLLEEQLAQKQGIDEL